MRPLTQAPATLAPPPAPSETVRSESFKFRINDLGGQTFFLEGTCRVVNREHADGSTTQHLTLRGKGVCARGNEYVFDHEESDRPKTGDFRFCHRVPLISKGSPPDEAMIFSHAKGEYTAQVVCRG